MAQLQHWLVTCTTCDGPAEYHCNTCGDILCPRCREIHQRSRGTGHHSIVPYTERIEPGKLTGECDFHPDHQLTLWDQTCDKAACTECVTSAEHKGHNFDKIAAKLEAQRKTIKEEFDTFCKLLQTWKDSLQKIHIRKNSYENDLDELGKEISRSADRVCDQVRNIEAALQKQLYEMKNTQCILLQDQEEALTNGIDKIKRKIREAEDKLRSENVWILIRHRVNTDKGGITTPPVADPPPLPVFTPGSLDSQSLEAILGSLSFEKKKLKTQNEDGKMKLPQSKTLPVSADEKDVRSHRELSQTTSYIPGSVSSAMSILPAATVMSIIQTSKVDAAYLAYTRSGQAWVKTGEEQVQLMNIQGSVKKSIKINIRGMTTTRQGDFLISHYEYFNDIKSIKSITPNGKIKTLFRTQWVPDGMCCLQNSDVVVTFYDVGNVVQYSRAGKMVRELDSSPFTHPNDVAQNRTNNHIYVCDKSDYGPDKIGKLLAFDDVTGKLLYEYTGSDASTFTPCYVCTDQAGHVIITDYSNHRIHILDENGRFLQYMITKDQGLYRPFCIDTDTDGHVWVCEWEYKKTSQVKILKYMS